MNTRELLQLKKLAPLHLVAGRVSDQPISAVTMMDAPDIIPFLHPYDLIITTAYHLQNNSDYFMELIHAMAKVNCAGIGVKMNRFLTEIPESVLALANDYGLPFFKLPEHLSLGEMNYTITEHILMSETKALTRAMDVQRTLTDMIVKGHGIPRILRELESILHYKVHVITPYLRPLFPAQTTSEIVRIIQNWHKDSLLHTTIHKELLICSIATQTPYTIFEIQTTSKRPFLLIFEESITKERFEELLIIEQASHVLSFAILQDHALKQQQRTIANDQLQDFLLLDNPSASQTTIRMEELGIEANKQVICICGRIQEQLNSFSLQETKILLQIHEFVEDLLRESRIPLKVFVYGEELLLLYTVNDASVDYCDFITEVLNEITQSIISFFSLHFRFGVSNILPNFEQLKRGYKEATSAAKTLTTTNITFYKKKDLFELLQMIPIDDLQSYSSTVFKPFSKLPSEEANMLLKTLYSYLESHCQISETAKQLFVHRNTVIYRLDKCSQLLKKDLKNPDVTMQLRLALRIRNTLAKSTIRQIH